MRQGQQQRLAEVGDFSVPKMIWWQDRQSIVQTRGTRHVLVKPSFSPVDVVPILIDEEKAFWSIELLKCPSSRESSTL